MSGPRVITKAGIASVTLGSGGVRVDIFQARPLRPPAPVVAAAPVILARPRERRAAPATARARAPDDPSRPRPPDLDLPACLGARA